MSSSEYVLNGTLIFATWKFADSIKAHLTVLVWNVPRLQHCKILVLWFRCFLNLT